jgi:type IV secretion system protein VirB11
MSQVPIDTYLRPLKPFLDLHDISEISINKPREIWIEKLGSSGGMERHNVPELTFAHLQTLAQLIAQFSEQDISEETPLLSATLPEGYRVQVVLPPATEPEAIGISIRKQALLDLTLDDYQERGAFSEVNKEIGERNEDQKLTGIFQARQYRIFLERALISKKNILVSAGTSAGKTTFLNACLKAIPMEERIITIEDAREVIPTQPNRLHLLASRGGQGRAKVTPQHLLEASLRLRPDRIILGELRGAEAFTFLRAINSGHPGSITTIHADNPRLAFEQLALLVMQANLGMNRHQILEYVRSIIPIVVQLKRDEKGRRYLSEVYYREVA